LRVLAPVWRRKVPEHCLAKVPIRRIDDERLAQGNVIGRDIWRRIVATIWELRRVTRRVTE